MVYWSECIQRFHHVSNLTTLIIRFSINLESWSLTDFQIFNLICYLDSDKWFFEFVIMSMLLYYLLVFAMGMMNMQFLDELLFTFILFLFFSFLLVNFLLPLFFFFKASFVNVIDLIGFFLQIFYLFTKVLNCQLHFLNLILKVFFNF